jgi:hypothetical protein
MSLERMRWPLLIGLLWLVWWAGLYGADADAIWQDEAWTAYYIGAIPQSGGAGVPDLFARMAAEAHHENNPPTYYLLLLGWAHLTGWSDVTLRWLSVFITLVGVAAVYRTAHDTSNVATGLVAAWVFGLSGFTLTYAHDMRMYALSLMLAALGFWAYNRYTSRHRHSWGWGLLIAVCAAGLVYTHYYNALIMLPLGIYHLFAGRKRAGYWGVFGWTGAAVVAFLPYAPTVLGRSQQFLSATDTIIPDWTAADIAYMLLDGFANGLPWLLIVPLSGAVLAIWRPQNTDERRVALWALSIALMGIVMIATTQAITGIILHVRYLLTLWVPLALAVAFGLNRIGRPMLTGAFIVAWAVMGVWAGTNPAVHWRYTDPTTNELFRTDLRWDNTGDILAAEVSSYDAVLMSVSDYYPFFQRRVAGFYLRDVDGRALFAEFTDNPAVDIRYFLQEAAQVWLVRAADQPASMGYTVAQDYAEHAYALCEIRTVGDITLERYAITAACCAPPDTPQATFAQGVTLYQTTLEPTGDNLDVWQSWAVPDSFDIGGYSVGLYLLDADGNVTVQADYPLPDAPVCPTVRLPVKDIPDGDYSLRVSVYDWRTLDTLTPLDAAQIPLPLAELRFPAQ